MLTVGSIGRAEHEAFVAGRPASFLQQPAWAEVKEGWRPEPLAWRDASGEVVGTVLVLLRDVPLVGRSVAWIAEGPVIDHERWRPEDWLGPLRAHHVERGVVLLRLGVDLAARSWTARTLKDAVGPGRDVRDLPPDAEHAVAAELVDHLEHTGWTRAGAAAVLPGTPAHRFVVPLDGLDEQSLLARMNQQFRRGVRKADAAGVRVVRGGADRIADFHAVYVETAHRDAFPPHGRAHFDRMWQALDDSVAADIRLYLAELDGEVLAAMLVVISGDVAGYAYGGSVSHRRDAFPSNAAHWQIMCDLLAEGVQAYDMRGVDSTLDPDAHRFGVLRFKLGTGGRLDEHVGDWNLVVSPLWWAGLRTAMRLRSTLERVRGARRGGGAGPA